MNYAIDVSGLSKNYGSNIAVDDLSFKVLAGDIFSFLGTNGAGKTTTISAITTVLDCDAGDIIVAGYRVGEDSLKIRNKIGVVFQKSLLDPKLSVSQNLHIRAGFYGLNKFESTKRIDKLARILDITSYLRQEYGKLSGGQQRRVDIARSLIHEPEVLFLDEPTAGLDPASREKVWKTIHYLREHSGLTVFLTTHYMEETESSDQVAIVDRGKIVASGTPSVLRERYSKSILTLVSSAPDIVRDYCMRFELGFIEQNSIFQVEVSSSGHARELLVFLGDKVTDFEFRHGTMNDVFLNLTDKMKMSR